MVIFRLIGANRNLLKMIATGYFVAGSNSGKNVAGGNIEEKEMVKVRIL